MTVVSTIKSNPPMVADELRRQADHFYDLKYLVQDIGREGACEESDINDEEFDNQPEFVDA